MAKISDNVKVKNKVKIDKEPKIHLSKFLVDNKVEKGMQSLLKARYENKMFTTDEWEKNIKKEMIRPVK